MVTRYDIEVNFKGNWMKHTDVQIVNTLKEYEPYMTELNNKFKVSESEIKNNKTWVGHGHGHLTSIAGMGNMIEKKEDREPMLHNLKMLHGTVVANQMSDLLDGKILIINKRGGYFRLKSKDEYRIIKKSNTQYSEDSIRINKWWGGVHYYAKIDTIDVIDDNGDIKWNTAERAREIAMQYLAKLNNGEV